MQRLDAEPDSALAGVWHDRRNTLRHHLASPVDIAIGRGAADQHDARRPQLGRLINRAPVIIDSLEPLGLRRRGKKAAAAQARNTKPRIADHAHAVVKTDFLNPVAPGSDPSDAVTHASVHAFLERRVFRGDLIKAESRDHTLLTEVPPTSPPASSNRPCMRRQARSGSCKTPACSASTSSFERCEMLRAVSSPPIIWKRS